MKKDKEWLKEETRKLRITHEKYGTEYSMGVIGACALFLLQIDQLDEPEVLIAEREVVKEPEKVVVPASVAKWIESAKDKKYNLYGVFQYAPDRIDKWLFDTNVKSERVEMVARAWLDGYVVEEEQKYWVKDRNGCWLLIKTKKGIEVYDKHIPYESGSFLELTEQEIKDYDERYWPFAEEVTE